MTATTEKDGTGWRQRLAEVPGGIKAGLIIGVLAFVLSFEVKTEGFVSGEATCTGFDFVPWAFGIIGVVVGIVAVIEARKSDKRGLWTGLGLVVIALGVVNVLRAYQVIMPIC
ncbi:MAG: hypothetical protein AAGK32_08315 [Actinomycetota bacterium]